MDRSKSEERVRDLMAQLDSLLDGAEAAARLVACGEAAILPLREFLIDGRARGVFQPRLWAVQALGGLGADDVLIEYLQRPIPSTDAVVRFAEQAVRSGTAKALRDTDRPDGQRVLLEVARTERLPGALEALEAFDPALAIPILVNALSDDFARDAAQTTLRRFGNHAAAALIEAAIDAGDRPQATLRRRLVALDLLRDLDISDAEWTRLSSLLDEPDAELVCAASVLGIDRAPDPGRIARRLLAILPEAGWEWTYTLEEVTVRCAVRAGKDFQLTFSAETRPERPHVLMILRRIHRRLAELRVGIKEDPGA